MTHLVGIDKGPVMDWTNDIGLGERYRKWKKRVEVLFKGPLNAVAMEPDDALRQLSVPLPDYENEDRVVG